MSTEVVESVCNGIIAQERGSQCADLRGWFASKQKESLGAVDGGEMTRSVTAYVSPKGCGYEVSFCFSKDGRTWRRVVNTGPEQHRELAWFEAVKPRLQ